MGTMKITIADTYAAMSQQAAEELAELLKEKEHPLLCTASGDSPAGLYNELVRLHRQNIIDATTWYFAGLDEWVGKSGRDEGSCRYYLDQQLYRPLNIPVDRISFFDGHSSNLQDECRQMETFLQLHEPIEAAVVGLGMNGHIGFNEPGISPSLTTHIANLDKTTIETGQKYFKEQQQLAQGITIGLATLMEAKHVFLLVSGAHKADIVQKALEGPVTENLPATLLRHHPNLHVYLDREAAQLLSTQKQ